MTNVRCSNCRNRSWISAKLPAVIATVVSLYSHTACFSTQGEHTGRRPSQRVFFARHSLHDSATFRRFRGTPGSVPGGIRMGRAEWRKSRGRQGKYNVIHRALDGNDAVKRELVGMFREFGSFRGLRSTLISALHLLPPRSNAFFGFLLER